MTKIDMLQPENLYQKQLEFIKKIEEISKERKEHYVSDGIINPERYVKAKPRILWILKEPVGSSSWSYLEEINNKTDWFRKYSRASPTLRRMIYTSYAILKGSQWRDIPYANEEAGLDIMQEIAFINIKKSPGDSTSEYETILEHYRQNKELLKEQIDMCNADIIIFGNTLEYFDMELFEGLAQADKQRTDWGNVFYDTGKKLYIYTWHPSVRGAGFNDEDYVMDIADIVKSWSRD